MVSSSLGFKPKPRVGLLGGSFDPPHEGHVLITLESLKRLNLDEVWWLVSPQNPLKNRRSAPVAQRMAQAHAILEHPKVKITNIEEHLGCNLTHETVAALRRSAPKVSFVWIMGGDNLAQFHRWQEWKSIMAQVPIAVFARPGHRARAQSAPAARFMRPYKIPDREGRLMTSMAPPVWTYLTMPLSQASSSALRSAPKVSA